MKNQTKEREHCREMWQRLIRGGDIGGGGCVPALSPHKVPLSSEPCTRQQWVWVTRRLPKNLGVRNGAFVSSAHIVVDKEGTATGRVGGGRSEKCSFTSGHFTLGAVGQQMGKKTAESYSDWVFRWLRCQYRRWNVRSSKPEWFVNVTDWEQWCNVTKYISSSTFTLL